MKELKYLGVLFMNEGEMITEADRYSLSSNVGDTPTRPEGEALNLTVNLHSNP